MAGRSSLLALLLPVLAGASAQYPLFSNSADRDCSDSAYQFQWPIKKVAIIGAGVGGLIAYRELSQAGFDVHVYEREDFPGGNWYYTEEIPLDAPVPNADISVGDYSPSFPPEGVKLPYAEEYSGEEAIYLRRAHRAPKPIWATLKSNAPGPVQQVREFPWPEGAPWELPHQQLQRYLRAFASWHGVNNNDNNPRVSYNTRVELAEQRFNEDGSRQGWTLTLKNVVPIAENITKATWTKESYDAVVVATGRYNAPNIPDIEGLKEWAELYPGKISHSRQYRHPQPFTNKTVLIVGAATSGGEISREINPYVQTIYQSVRPDKATVPHFALKDFLRRLPPNTTVVPEIKKFHPAGSSSSEGRIELVNGTTLTGIEHVIFATGFRYTFPFLPQYHNSKIRLNETVPRDQTQPIVTDGTHVRSLYLDLFYIQDPTLGFLNLNFGMQSFTYAEFLSLALGKVWSNKAELPSQSEQWRRYDDTVKARKGYGRNFQFLGAERTRDALRFFQGWLNDAAVRFGGRQIDGLPKELAEISRIWSTARFADQAFQVSVNALDNFDEYFSNDHDIKYMNQIESEHEYQDLIEDLVFNDYY